MDGSIRFNNDINVEVAVDPTAAEGARLTGAKNQVDGQELGASADLPAVTEADAGKVLAVNDSGEWAAESPYDFIVRVDLAEGVFVSATTIYMADADYLKNKIDNHIPIIGYAYNVDADMPDLTTIYSSVIQGIKETDGEDIFYDIAVLSTLDFEHKLRFGYSLNTLEWWVD